MKEMGRRRRRRGHKKVCGKREADGENRGKGGGRGIRMTEVWKRWTLMRDAEERGKKTGREMCILLKILYRWRTGHMQVIIKGSVHSNYQTKKTQYLNASCLFINTVPVSLNNPPGCDRFSLELLATEEIAP